MKYSKGDGQSIYAAVFTRRRHDEPWYVFAFIINPTRKNKMHREAMGDYLWQAGFRDGLCLKV